MNNGYGPQEMDTAQDLIVRAGRRADPPIHDAYVCIYLFICTELIEETGRPPGLFFCMWGYFWPGSHRFESWKKFYTFAGFIT